MTFVVALVTVESSLGSWGLSLCGGPALWKKVFQG